MKKKDDLPTLAEIREAMEGEFDGPLTLAEIQQIAAEFLASGDIEIVGERLGRPIFQITKQGREKVDALEEMARLHRMIS